MANNLIFNYATDYQYSHSSIETADKFSLTDEGYATFKSYVLEQDFSYSTASEEMLKKMKKTAEDEGFYEDAKAEYDALMAAVVPSKERDLEKFKSQIKSILENEIVSRYYYQSGRAQNSFLEDPFILESKTILQNFPKYNTILGN